VIPPETSSGRQHLAAELRPVSILPRAALASEASFSEPETPRPRVGQGVFV
jgi:hypothetical protein